MRKIASLIPIFFLMVLTLSSARFKETSPSIDNTGVFRCIIEDKPFVINGIYAVMRTVTGGQRQLSLSNDRFSKFFLITPSEKSIELGNAKNREAVVYYMDPVNMTVYKPQTGSIKINKLDESLKVLSGEFEMELTSTITGKKIKIKDGKLLNIPIVYEN